MGGGRSYVEVQGEQVECVECGEFLAIRSMSSHLITRHGKATGRLRLWNPQTGGGVRTYRMSFPAKGEPP